jgi:cell division protein FtsW (lipid II flippase)
MSLFSRTDRSFLGKWWWTLDRGLLAAFLFLAVCGAALVMTSSASVAERIGAGPYHFIIRHLEIVVPALADGALAALDRGDLYEHDRRVAIAARQLANCSVIALAQFSLARAAGVVGEVTGRPVLTTPDSAVRKMQRLLVGA